MTSSRGVTPVQPGPDFVVLTGFLGSGKTTLLREFITGPDAADTAVIVNEIGAIGLDGALLSEAGGTVAASVPTTTLASGCICCQLGSDLTLTVEALLASDRPAGTAPLRRIVLETSGVSKPGPILRQLGELARYRMRVSVVATFDPLMPPDRREIDEALAQWAGAGRIVVTKADRAGPEGLRVAAEDAAGINPLAEIVAERSVAASAQGAFAPAGRASVHPPPMRFRSADRRSRLTTLLLRQEADIPFDDLAAWLDNLAGRLGETLLRLKGLVRVHESDAPLLVQSVGTLFSPPRPFRGETPAKDGFLVVIGRDLDPAVLAEIEPALPWRIDGTAGSGAMRAEALGGEG